ncbi:MAG TPA: plastocyanin/azurin family copper-binding protein [Flavipsychrobacter sp.]|jgi:plastocyanin|nr:plastocyanin/azurin family copper-binding protein [Flavipsychrobacter sp.]
MRSVAISAKGALLVLGIALAQMSCNGTQAPTTHVVEIARMQFIPAELTVHKGDTVVFVNHDMLTHDITEEGKLWTSSKLPPDSSWTMVTTQTANYYCSLHPVMKGKIIIQ